VYPLDTVLNVDEAPAASEGYEELPDVADPEQLVDRRMPRGMLSPETRARVYRDPDSRLRG